MVNREIIYKTLSLIIDSKCKKPSYSLINISNHVKGAMNRFARSTQTQTVEHGVIIDGHGHPIKQVIGHESSVFIPVENTVSKILEEKCKDILEEYKQKYLTTVGEENLIFLRDKYERLIYERLESLGEDGYFHVDHNHPGPYADAELDYNMFTCLSKGDLDNCLLRSNIGVGSDGDGFFINNIVKSKTAECSNGSRMTLVNKNPFDVVVNKRDFNIARNNLLTMWNSYYSDLKNEALHYAKDILVAKYGESQVKADRNNLKTEIGQEVNEHLKKWSIKNFPKMIKGNIKEFEELGFELRVDWL